MAAHAAPCHKWRQSPVPKLAKSKQRNRGHDRSPYQFGRYDQAFLVDQGQNDQSQRPNGQRQQGQDGQGMWPPAGTLATTAPVARRRPRPSGHMRAGPVAAGPSGRWPVAGWLAPRAAAVDSAAIWRWYGSTSPQRQRHRRKQQWQLCAWSFEVHLSVWYRPATWPRFKKFFGTCPRPRRLASKDADQKEFGAQNVPGLIAAATTTNLAPDCFGPALISARRYPVPTSGRYYNHVFIAGPVHFTRSTSRIIGLSTQHLARSRRAFLKATTTLRAQGTRTVPADHAASSSHGPRRGRGGRPAGRTLRTGPAQPASSGSYSCR